MSVGRNNYLVICCQSGKCIFFPVHLEGTSLSSFPLFSLWGCFLFCTFGFFAMHTGKYWFSPESRIHKSSAVLCSVLLFNDAFLVQLKIVARLFTEPPAKTERTFQCRLLMLFFYWVCCMNQRCCLFCYISIFNWSAESLNDMICFLLIPVQSVRDGSICESLTIACCIYHHYYNKVRRQLKMFIVAWNFTSVSQSFLLVSDGQSLVCLLGQEHSEGLRIIS